MATTVKPGRSTYYLFELACYYQFNPDAFGSQYWQGKQLAVSCCRQEISREYDIGPWLALCDLLEECGVVSDLRSEVVGVFNLG